MSSAQDFGRVLVTTEDGTMGEKGFVTNHSVLQQETFNLIQVCGPTPMMKAVARYASEKGIYDLLHYFLIDNLIGYS